MALFGKLATSLALFGILEGSLAHYMRPPCGGDEEVYDIASYGQICAPLCTSHACPTDVPKGITASPLCTPAGRGLCTDATCCGLQCSSDAECGGSAMGGICVPDRIMVGFCVWRFGPAPSPWPTFGSLAALQADPWANYYKEVYGGLPTSFPAKTEDLWMIYDIELVDAKVKNAPASVGTCPTSNPPSGQRYNINNQYEPPGVSWIWHPYPYQEMAASSWTEILHEADPFGDEHFGAWFVYAPGSGIYFNVGKTIAFAEHQDAFNHFGVKAGDENEELSKAAAAQGYDSVQFLAHVDHVSYQCDTHNTGNAGLDYMGMEILACKLMGTFACGTSSGAPSVIKSGWQASKACACDNTKQFLNCQGVPMRTQATSTGSSHYVV